MVDVDPPLPSVADEPPPNDMEVNMAKPKKKRSYVRRRKNSSDSNDREYKEHSKKKKNIFATAAVNIKSEKGSDKRKRTKPSYSPFDSSEDESCSDDAQSSSAASISNESNISEQSNRSNQSEQSIQSNQSKSLFPTPKESPIKMVKINGKELRLVDHNPDLSKNEIDLATYQYMMGPELRKTASRSSPNIVKKQKLLQEPAYKPKESREHYMGIFRRLEYQNTHLVVRDLNAKDFTAEYVRKSGLKKPIIFTQQTEDLGILIPTDWTYRDVLNRLPQGTAIDVFNHSSDQQKLTPVRLIVDEIEKEDEGDRMGPLNMLSLECSYMDISKYISPPKLVRELDWGRTLFPRKKFAVREYSKVEKYILMSMKDSYTDFHIDFGGTSVWYHVSKGEKLFFLVEPTEHNVEIYYQWKAQHESVGGTVFFGDVVEKSQVCAVRLRAGQTLILPAGYIHAVYTPVDSLVFGGNFLHDYSIAMQMKINELETYAKMRKKFQYPFHTETLWYFAADIVYRATGRQYVRLLSATDLHREVEKQNRDPETYNRTHLYELALQQSECYDDIHSLPKKVIKKRATKVKGAVEESVWPDPVQETFDATDSNDRIEAPVYNLEYIRRIPLSVRRDIYKVRTHLLSKKSRKLVAEGIRRPNHMLKDLERVIDKALEMDYVEPVATSPNMENDDPALHLFAYWNQRDEDTKMSSLSNSVMPAQMLEAMAAAGIPAQYSNCQPIIALRNYQFMKLPAHTDMPINGVEPVKYTAVNTGLPMMALKRPLAIMTELPTDSKAAIKKANSSGASDAKKISPKPKSPSVRPSVSPIAAFPAPTIRIGKKNSQTPDVDRGFQSPLSLVPKKLSPNNQTVPQPKPQSAAQHPSRLVQPYVPEMPADCTLMQYQPTPIERSPYGAMSSTAFQNPTPYKIPNFCLERSQSSTESPPSPSSKYNSVVHINELNMSTQADAHLINTISADSKPPESNLNSSMECSLNSSGNATSDLDEINKALDAFF